eukprot:scaffold18711_cov119-Isochrysis_galbana.AAC.11
MPSLTELGGEAVDGGPLVLGEWGANGRARPGLPRVQGVDQEKRTRPLVHTRVNRRLQVARGAPQEDRDPVLVGLLLRVDAAAGRAHAEELLHP